jgi:Na+-transporting methylmalonyl-CoA/oxaloacetate decarboxylase gamma subunit
MSTLFGAYITLIGSAVVFAMLLAVAMAGGAVERLTRGKEGPDLSDAMKGGDERKAKAAAAAAAIYCMGVRRPAARVVSSGESRWSSVARVEALRTELDDRR